MVKHCEYLNEEKNPEEKKEEKEETDDNNNHNHNQNVNQEEEQDISDNKKFIDELSPGLFDIYYKKTKKFTEKYKKLYHWVNLKYLLIINHFVYVEIMVNQNVFIKKIMNKIMVMILIIKDIQ